MIASGLVALFVSACGDDSDGPADGSADQATRLLDTGIPDGRITTADLGSMDAGAPDAGRADAHTADSSAPMDASPADLGETDARDPDAGTTDAAAMADASADLGLTGDAAADSALDADGGGADAGPPHPNLILHFPFDGDTSNYGALGAAYDAVGRNIAFVGGRRDRAIAFSRPLPSGIDVPGSRVPLSTGTAYTFALWFREDAVTPDSFLFDFREDSAGVAGCHAYHGAAATAQITTCCSFGAPDLADCATFGHRLGQWHHYLLRQTGAGAGPAGGPDLEIFLDGALVATLANPGSAAAFSTAQRDLVFGRDPAYADVAPASFQIDDVRVYDTAFALETQCTEIIGGSWVAGACIPSPP